MAEGRLFLIHWNGAEAQELVRELEGLGWHMDFEAQDGARAAKRIREAPPEAAVIFLSRLPSHGRETAHALRSFKATRQLPIIFVDGQDEAVQKTREKVPDAHFVTKDLLQMTLEQVVRRKG